VKKKGGNKPVIFSGTSDPGSRGLFTPEKIAGQLPTAVAVLTVTWMPLNFIAGRPARCRSKISKGTAIWHYRKQAARGRP
jgi:hypothetical protein